MAQVHKSCVRLHVVCNGVWWIGFPSFWGFPVRPPVSLIKPLLSIKSLATQPPLQNPGQITLPDFQWTPGNSSFFLKMIIVSYPWLIHGLSRPPPWYFVKAILFHVRYLSFSVTLDPTWASAWWDFTIKKPGKFHQQGMSLINDGWWWLIRDELGCSSGICWYTNQYIEDYHQQVLSPKFIQ